MIGGLILAMTLAAAQDRQIPPPLILSGDTARPIGEQSWINLAEDYPAGALRGRMDGTVAVRLFVTGQGRVAGCLVLQSGMYSTLDHATCRMLRSRARFVPFAGNGLATFDYRIVWDLARATPIQAVPPESAREIEPVPAAH